MPLAFDTRVRVAVDVGGEDVVFICRTPTARETSVFLNNRFVTKRNKVTSHLYEARAEFISAIVVDVENAQFRNAAGEVLPLNAQTVLTDDDKRQCGAVLGVQIETWKDLIPLSWKSSAAMKFEDSQNASGEGEPEGN
jgi:hypothetical protein